ncbi:hypothetical protein P152DRAFT_209949 [Eremomyces bilateralis CBS 781.70]|uniref:HRQ family protein n=1 Tax=Eremomyces bilateralis CBS 781.70 TaxID=1392243 RepID=A0A6G1FSU3_9PEZI|nr:uncharacterized protein P152DRAFT_209949 [Eremomyces bilateralis CBS 781.70]KAF1808806.1 hypothetical protein P152DRAFT_209949 [Eremomyces bilateralis CBS 781.70]
MAELLYAALVALFFLGSGFILATNKTSRAVVLDRVRFRRRRSSQSKTPPRSLSPSTKEGRSLGLSEYADTFPPSRRCAVSDLGPDCPLLKDRTLVEFISTCPGSRTSLAPMDLPFSQWSPNHYTCMEFSKEEIEALGGFPDYAALSGVPLPQPYHEFDIDTAMSRPYRPFRWSYHQTMSLTKMESDWWLELAKGYADRVQQRQGIYEKVGKCVLDSLPGSELACRELMEMVVQFLCARYPQYFRLDKATMTLHNAILNTTSDLRKIDPLEVIMNNIPEDFAIMLRNPETGIYHLRAGVICSALGWNLGTKMGMKLDEIHGPIPDYKEKMQFSMDRYFAKKPSNKSIQRSSWGLEVDEPLYMPPGDPHEKYRDSQSPELNIDRCNLRVDWQTLRRLPLSGAIIFNFKALFTPVSEFRDEAYIPSLVLKVLREGKPSLMEYKSTWHTEHVVIPALEKYEKEQIEKEMIPPDWTPNTLDEAPYFPDWEEKWHRQQGY